MNQDIHTCLLWCSLHRQISLLTFQERYRVCLQVCKRYRYKRHFGPDPLLCVSTQPSSPIQASHHFMPLLLPPLPCLSIRSSLAVSMLYFVVGERDMTEKGQAPCSEALSDKSGYACPNVTLCGPICLCIFVRRRDLSRTHQLDANRWSLELPGFFFCSWVCDECQAARDEGGHSALHW